MRGDMGVFLLALLLGLAALLTIDAGIWLHDRFQEYRQRPPRQPVRYQRVRSNDKAEWDKVLESMNRRKSA